MPAYDSYSSLLIGKIRTQHLMLSMMDLYIMYCDIYFFHYYKILSSVYSNFGVCLDLDCLAIERDGLWVGNPIYVFVSSN